ncbi:MAG: hypothetical protein WCO98_03030 [bacterium]
MKYLYLLITLIISLPAFAIEKTVPDIAVIPLPTGVIITTDCANARTNWAAERIEAAGVSYITSFDKYSVIIARKAAYQVMRNEMKNIIPTIAVDAEKKISDAVKNSDDIVIKMVDQVKIIADYPDKKNKRYVIVGVLPIFGENGLTALAYNVTGNKVSAITAKDITFTSVIPHGHTPQLADGPYTGIIINNDTAQVKPSLLPRMLRFDGKEVWNPNDIALDKAASGPIRYSRNLRTAIDSNIAGTNPLILESVGNYGGYYPVFNVDDIIFMHQLKEEDDELFSFLPFIFTMGMK